MRVSLSELRDIGRQGSEWRPRDPDAVIVTPASIRTKAIAVYHEEGHSDALGYLAGKRPGSRGLSGVFGPGGKRANQGARTRAGFDRYVALDGRDGRPFAYLALSDEIGIANHQVGAYVDVVLFADGGYSGRVLNWDLEGVTDQLAELLAAQATVLIDRVLGSKTCVDVEVWDLEHRGQWLIDRAAAQSRVRDVAQLLDQAETLGA